MPVVQLPLPESFDSCSVFGGPYRERPAGTFGIKMAAEIAAPYDVSIPTQDYSVPDRLDMYLGVKDALVAMALDKTLYVGCMGGIGRTGLFMGVLLRTLKPEWSGAGVRSYIREHYHPHAIETQDQFLYLLSFPTTKLNLSSRKAARIIAFRTRFPWLWKLTTVQQAALHYLT